MVVFYDARFEALTPEVVERMLTRAPALPAGCGAALEVALNGQQFVALGARHEAGGRAAGAAWLAKESCTRPV